MCTYVCVPRVYDHDGSADLEFNVRGSCRKVVAKKLEGGTAEMTSVLYYYPACGRANQLRLALAEAGIAWKDEYPQGFPPTAEEVANWTSIGGNLTTNVPMLKTADGSMRARVCGG